MEKMCKDCLEIFSIENFYKSKRHRDGVDTRCKTCYNIYKKSYHVKYVTEIYQPPTTEILESISKTCHTCKVEKFLVDFKSQKGCKYGKCGTCKKCANQDKNSYRIQNKDKIKESAKIYKKNNKEKIKEWSASYYEENKERISLITKKYRKDNPDKLRSLRKEYEKNNRSKMTQKAAKRRTLKMKSHHPTNDPIIESIIYDMSTRITKCIGLDFHVDHILPLNQGGYHHHQNLQSIPGRVNESKHDSLDFRHPLLVHWTELPEFLLDRMEVR